LAILRASSKSLVDSSSMQKAVSSGSEFWIGSNFSLFKRVEKPMGIPALEIIGSM